MQTEPHIASDNRFHSLRGGFLLLLFLMLGLLSLSIQPARAASDATSTSQPDTSALSPEQTRQLIGVLKNDKERQKFLTTLQNMAQAQQNHVTPAPSTSTKAVTTATTPKTPPTPIQQLRPNSLGAELLGYVSVFANASSARFQALFRTVLDFRAVPAWVRYISHDLQAREEVLKTLLRATVFAGVAAGLVVLARLLIRLPQKRLEEKARQSGLLELERAKAEKAEADRAASRDAQAQEMVREKADAQAAATPSPQTAASSLPSPDDVEAEREVRLHHQGALARLMLAIHRAPFAIGTLLLDLFTVAMLPLAATLVIVCDPSGDATTALAVRDMAACGTIGGLAIFLARDLFAPTRPWMRLLTVNNWAAEYLTQWIVLLASIGTIGAAVIGLLDDCSLPSTLVVALSKILALLLHGLVAIMILRSRGHVMALCEHATQMGYASHILLLFGRVWWVAALFFDLGLWLVWAAEIENGYSAIWDIFLRSVLVLGLMRLLSIASYGFLERTFRNAPKWTSLSDDTCARLGSYYPIARRFLGAILFILTVVFLAIAWGVRTRDLFQQGGIGNRLLSSTMTTLIALAVATLVWEWANIAIERHIRKISGLSDGDTRVARIRTLQPMLRILLLVILGVILGLTILSQIGINTAPLLAGASIFGVALGFGSQKLVQDFINGIFLLLENALTVGDAVTLNGIGGTIERLSLRTVHVRGSDGSMNIFPFSSLGQITNFNRDFARALIVARVGYDADTDAVVQALRDITKSMREDPAFKDLITDDFQLWGVDALGDFFVTISGTLPTTTAGRWPVQREFNRRMKKCFEERNITIPYPIRRLEIDGLHQMMPNPPPQPQTGA
ncbi:mechanosensitive ion channel family protein [Gluconobacter morbifer]|uniref:Uncharacterized protein n=1 Tax=Gluconobacter morbifer G707 TaxID=1088869 RepID=G6XHK5_9PROT|nr:mechanosensitive ion channel domain-containing protein [Gluconobacter morbifer]EHH69663.1 hypothetical protein GMO_09710 [Gluconobacter morbifer G707]